MNLELLVAAVSGLIAGISPCALPVYPALLNRLTASRSDPKWITVFFVLGLAGLYFLLYVIIGSVAAFAGRDFLETGDLWRWRLTLVGAIFSWIMAYATLRGGLKIPSVSLIKGESGSGYIGAFISGAVYGSIITSCNAPFLVVGILPAIASSRSIFEGVIMLAVFSAAMGLPFLLLGWASGAAMKSFSFIKRNTRKLEIASALFLIGTGVYFFYLFSLTL